MSLRGFHLKLPLNFGFAQVITTYAVVNVTLKNIQSKEPSQ